MTTRQRDWQCGVGKEALEEEGTAYAEAHRINSQGGREEGEGGEEGRDRSHQQRPHILKGLAYLRAPPFLVNFGSTQLQPEKRKSGGGGEYSGREWEKQKIEGKED